METALLRASSESITCLANVPEIFPFQFLFLLILDFNNEKSPLNVTASNSAAEASGQPLAFWKRGLVLMRTRGSLLLPDMSLTTVMRLSG